MKERIECPRCTTTREVKRVEGEPDLCSFCGWVYAVGGRGEERRKLREFAREELRNGGEEMRGIARSIFSLLDAE